MTYGQTTIVLCYRRLQHSCSALKSNVAQSPPRAIRTIKTDADRRFFSPQPDTILHRQTTVMGLMRE